MRWGMIIDLQKCTGCYACQIACKEEHFLPPDVFWGRVIITLKGNYPAVRKYILPVLCNNCEEAPCVEVCPSGATQRREDGIVWVDYDKCVGCRYCVMACPYQNRSYIDDATSKREYFSGKGYTPMEELGRELYPLQKETVTKCDFCRERVDAGLEKGLNPAIDREARPACVNACPTHARCFGDVDDPQSEISQLERSKKGFQLHPEFGTKPLVWYVDY